MSKIYHKIYYHIVWSTYKRKEIINPDIEKYLFNFLKNKAKRFDCEIIEINGVSNHLHSIISIPPTVTISDIVGKLKGSSSYFLNKELNLTTYFRWQSGYGVLTISEKDLPRVISYIQNQKRHHSDNKTNEYLENCGEDD